MTNENKTDTKTDDGASDPMGEFGDLFGGMDEEYAKAPKEREQQEGKPIPEGTYQFLVTKTRIGRVGGKPDGMPQISFHLKVVGPNNIGRYVWKNSNITPKSLEFLRPELVLLQYEGTLRELETRHEEMIGVVVEGRIKHDPKQDKPGEVWVRVYLNKFIRRAHADEVEAGGASSDSDDASFDTFNM